MRHIIIAVLTGIFFVVAGIGLLAVIFPDNLDLNCRDCQNAAGALLLIIIGVAVGLFLIGAMCGGVASYFIKKNKQGTPGAEIKRNTTVDSGTYSTFFTPTTIKKIIALFLISIILIAFFLHALGD